MLYKCFSRPMSFQFGMVDFFRFCRISASNQIHDFAAVTACLVNRFLENTVAHGIERGKTEVFKFNAKACMPKRLAIGAKISSVSSAMRRRAFSSAGNQWCACCGAGRQLDQDDANIAGHGHDHFTKIFCLRLGMAFKGNLGQLVTPSTRSATSLPN